MIDSVISGKHSDTALNRAKNKCQIPEMRLLAAMPAFFFIPAGYLIYAWTTEKGVGVYAPLIGLFVCKYLLAIYITYYFFLYIFMLIIQRIDALGQMWAFTPISVYLVDSKPGKFTNEMVTGVW